MLDNLGDLMLCGIIAGYVALPFVAWWLFRWIWKWGGQ